MNHRTSLLAASAALLLPPSACFACATCGCSLSTDAAMGFAADSGWRLSLQYDFIDQNQLRSGGSAVSPSQVAAQNPAAGQEVENQTVNRTTTLGVSYSANADWNFRALIPTIDRGHTTYGAATNPLSADELSGASATGLGDVKLMVGYQGLLPNHGLDLQFGLKLPTGAYGSGPDANGNNVGRGYA
ncbi:MAG: transporter, partial [Burkholderiales bacterium]|nr:transporter [Burkholderiales bacterium]